MPKKISKKSNKNIIKKLIKKTKKNNNKIKKTIKNKENYKSCETFCRKDYLPELNKAYKRSAERMNVPYVPPTKEDEEFAYNVCKKTFCNDKCQGYDFFGNEKQELDFKKKIKDGFKKEYTQRQIDLLKKKGALSGCVYVVDYDVFHK